MRSSLPLAALFTAIPVTAGAEPAAQQLAALQALQPGEWELRSRNPSDAAIRLCAADLRQLLQPRHAGQSCPHFVVENAARRAVVTYECAGSGQGRTSLRVETARLVQVDSQGIASGLPFALVMEGRRIGDCKSQVAAR